VALVNSTTETFKKPRQKERTDRAWFSRLVRHPARKRSGSILTTPEPARGAGVDRPLPLLLLLQLKFVLVLQAIIASSVDCPAEERCRKLCERSSVGHDLLAVVSGI